VNLHDDDFALFDLPQRQQLDRAALDARRRALQAELHPDRFVREGEAAQRLSTQWAVRVNEAWQRLRDPLSRAAYLCALRGLPVAAEGAAGLSQALLLRQIDWREALEDARDTAAVQALDASVAAEEGALQARLVQALDEANDTPAAAALVRELMFVTRFRDDIARRLDAP